MATTNPITGDAIQTKTTSDAYRDNYDRIFGKKKVDNELPIAYDGKNEEKVALNDAISVAMNIIAQTK